MPEPMPRYTCRGPVRGSCGTWHRSIEAAARCCLRDQRNCAAAGGYSDRWPVHLDGTPLNDDERAAVLRALQLEGCHA